MKRLFLLGFSVIFSMSALAESPGWIHDAAISPDGSRIAFSYKGEIFTVKTEGGKAQQITSNAAFDGNPVWSPDSKKIVFLSTREGSDDIFITNADGGTPRRLTTHSKNEFPLTFVNDSILLFNASLLPGRETVRAPFLTQIYSLNTNINNPRPKLFISLPVVSAAANQKGGILFQDRKGVEDVLRKHERSSGTSDIIYYSDGKFTKLTDFNGQDQSPAWGNGDTFFYLTEEDSTLNVFQSSVTNPKEKKQLTRFTKNPVRSLTASDNGILAFTQDGQIFTLKPGEEPRKVTINIEADFYDSDEVKRYVTSGATNMAVSPEGNEIAIIIRGELYVTDSKYKTTKRITNTPDQERSMSFSPDGRSIVFDSDVNGNWGLYLAKIKNPDEKNFAYATDIEIEPLYTCSTSAMQPEFSPDGKKVAFLENRDELRVIDIATKKVTTVIPGENNYSYSDGDIPFSWSPDSQWLLSTFIGKGGWNNLDIAVAKADGSKVINLTESGYTNSNPKWALNGKAVTYATGHYGMKAHASWGNQDDIMLMVLDPETWEIFNFTEEEADLLEKEKGKEEDKESESKSKSKDKKKDKTSTKEKNASTDLDFENRRYRTRRLTPTSSVITDYYLSPKGDKLYFFTENTEGGTSLNVTDIKEKETTRILKDIDGAFATDLKEKKIFIFSPEKISNIDPEDYELTTIEYEAPYNRQPSLEREYIFDHVAKQVEDKFYDQNLHGTDWKNITSHYKEFLTSISNNRDFVTLLSEMLGELNASHTGARHKAPNFSMETASLGAYFDEEFDEDGLKISEILPWGPLTLKSAGLNVGDIIVSIDGTTISKDTDYYKLLEGKAGKKTRLGIKTAQGKDKFVYIKPVSQAAETEYGYRRWIERNEQIVDSLSSGRIGYVHVKGMDGPSFQDVYDRMLGKYRNCDAIIVDTRYNGGGWLHNDIAVLLSGKKYVSFTPRGKFIGIEPFSQWSKPSVMLVNEANYSDAHGTPFTYKTLGLGELVGAPVPGTMTAVWWEYQIEPSIVFGIPQVTNIDNNGQPLENRQLDPDVLIYNSPELLEKGVDSQLEGAVKHLLNKTKGEETNK